MSSFSSTSDNLLDSSFSSTSDNHSTSACSPSEPSDSVAEFPDSPEDRSSSTLMPNPFKTASSFTFASSSTTSWISFICSKASLIFSFCCWKFWNPYSFFALFIERFCASQQTYLINSLSAFELAKLQSSLRVFLFNLEAEHSFCHTFCNSGTKEL